MPRGDPASHDPSSSRVPTAAWVLAVLAIAAALAGCLAGNPLDTQTAPDAGEGTPAEAYTGDLPDDVSMEGGEVLRRTDDAVLFRWEEPAPVVAGPATARGSPTLKTTFEVPADRFLRINVSAGLQGDGAAASWTVLLRDADGTVRCADQVGRSVDAPSPATTTGSHRARPANCRIDPLQPVPERRTWTLEAHFERNAGQGAVLEAVLYMETVLPGVLHEVQEVRDVSVEADDGATLRGHVYLPDGPGPHPTILQYTPYQNPPGSFATGGSGDFATEEGNRTTLPLWMGRFLERGYAIAFVNTRGTGISDGCNSLFNPHVDGPDAANVIDALGNASWSDGTVGMVGGSAPGYTQYAALLEQPEPLKAVAPVSAIVDLWTLYTRHGPTIFTGAVPMPVFSGVPTGKVVQGVAAGEPGHEPRHVRCPSYARNFAAMNQLVVDGDETDYFERRQAYQIIEDNDIPMFLANGLLKLGEGHILQIQDLWPHVNDESRLLIGQWPHAYPQATPGSGPGDYWDMVLDWMEYHLRGTGPAPPGGVVDYQDDAGEWHRAESWPPTHDFERIHLSDGSVVDDPSQVQASSQAFKAADHDPRPTACRESKALYVSPPLGENVRLAGHSHANVTVTSTAPNSNFGVYVWAVDELDPCTDPSDHAQRWGTSPYSLAYPEEVSRALSDLRHRGHLREGKPFPVGSPGVMSMKGHPLASQAEAGQRLVVGVSGGAVELSNEDPDPVLRVQTGPDVEGWVDLPVVEGEIAFQDGEAS